MNENEKNIVCFPVMHNDFVKSWIPEKIKFINPGFDTHLVQAWKPEGLIFSNKEIKKLINDYLNFGEQFVRPADIAALAAKGIDDHYANSTMAIKSELTGKKKSGPGLKDISRQAQSLLALQYINEQKELELRELDKNFQQGRDKFDKILGLEQDDLEELELKENTDLEQPVWPWDKLLLPFLFFLPPGWGLWLEDQSIRNEFEDMGVTFESLNQKEAQSYGLKQEVQIFMSQAMPQDLVDKHRLDLSLWKQTPFWQREVKLFSL